MQSGGRNPFWTADSDVLYETGDWLLFDPGQGWVSAPPGEADRAAKDVLADLRWQGR